MSRTRGAIAAVAGRGRGGILALALALLAAGPTTPAPAQEAAGPGAAREVRALLAAGRLDEAARRAEAALAQRPGDPELRFLRGVALAESGRADEAIEVFRALTEDYPDLPEPHNNLAVLYAAKGDYERARDALLVAINTHPSYATAHENLGDIYAKMAGIAYDRALALDADNRSARAKLELLQEILSLRAPAPSAPAAGSASAPVAAQDAAAAPPDEAAAIATAVQAWASAWSRQDVDAYLSHYAAAFVPPEGLDRSRWAERRAERIRRPAFIEVRIDDLRVEVAGPGRAIATFVQSYRSDTYRDRVRKRLDLVREGDRWRIAGERALGALPAG